MPNKNVKRVPEVAKFLRIIAAIQILLLSLGLPLAAFVDTDGSDLGSYGWIVGLLFILFSVSALVALVHHLIRVAISRSGLDKIALLLVGLVVALYFLIVLVASMN